jgi:hypothetical protein
MTQMEVVEIAMHLESMIGGNKMSVELVHVQSQLANLTMQLHDMAKAKVVYEYVWCTLYRAEGHHRKECSMLRIYTVMDAPNAFLNEPQTEWCEICKKLGHIPSHFPSLNK